MSVEFLSYFNEIGCTNVPDISWVTTAGNWKTVSGGASAFEPAFNWVQWVRDHSENDYYNLIYIDSNNYLRLVKRSGSYQYKTEWCYNGTIIQGPSSANNADQNLGYFAFGIDDDNQIGYMSFIKQRSSSATTTFAVSSVYNGNTGGHKTDFYNLIKNSIPTHQFISGGAGSGYIGNSLLSNKKMVGYNVPTSDATNTKTESVQVYSAAPLANKPKMGDGFARIKFLREYDPVPSEYKDYIDIINGKEFATNYCLSDNWICNCNASNASDGNAILTNSKNYSYIAKTRRGLSEWNNENKTYVAYYDSSDKITLAYSLNPVNIYITSSGNDYQITTSVLTNVSVYKYYNTSYYDIGIRYANNKWRHWSVSYTSAQTIEAFTYIGTLENCFKMIAMNFRNVDIYVDGVCWSKVSPD